MVNIPNLIFLIFAQFSIQIKNREICVVGLTSWNSKLGTHIFKIIQLKLKIFPVFLKWKEEFIHVFSSLISDRKVTDWSASVNLLMLLERRHMCLMIFWQSLLFSLSIVRSNQIRRTFCNIRALLRGRGFFLLIRKAIFLCQYAIKF
jgi:hypothetical protein